MTSYFRLLFLTTIIISLSLGNSQLIFATEYVNDKETDEQHIELNEEAGETDELEQSEDQEEQEYPDSELDDRKYTKENELIEQNFDEDKKISTMSTEKTLKFTVGDSGPHVKELKINLSALGYGNFPANPSNIYGTVTANVVKGFQKDNGLKADGIANQQTIDTIQNLLNFSLSSADVIQLKKDLTALGFGSFPANPSGVYGTVTKNVVKQFQAYAKLPQTGLANKATLNKIKEVLNPPYRIGDRGVAIIQLKKDLRKLGYGNFPANPSNTYGTVTANVVKNFQKDNGLKADGIVNQQTLDTVQNLLAFSLSSADVIQLKKDLTALGFGSFPANPSGVYGTVTKNVVKQFQAYAKLSQTGLANKATLNKVKEVLNPPYKIGDRGVSITQLKKDLRKLGYGNFPANPSNTYGTVTANVVKNLQKDNGLKADGIVGQQTLDTIQDLLNFSPSSADVIQLKKDLTALGFGSFPATPSGVYGTVTKNVVKQFQAYAKLPQTGLANKATLNKVKEVLNPPYRTGDRGVAITQLKKDLRKLGYGNFPANPSNVYGSVTSNVVKSFQKDNGLKADGVAGQQTLDKIEILIKELDSKPIIKTEYTNYNLTLTQAVNRQLADSVPQTDKYKNDPAYVSANLINISGKAKSIDDQVTIHSKPNLLYPTTTKLVKDEEVTIVNEVSDEITRKNDEWIEISNNGKKGYVEKASLRATEGVITGSTVNVRADKNTSSHIYGTLNKGAKVNVINTTGSWYEVQYNTWRLPTATDLSKEMNPNNVDKFQHLRLDSLAGATASQLNKMLNGKGTLNKQGQAFINGAKQGKVNEAYLISHASLETGNGTSKLAKGIEVGKNKSGKPTVVTSSNRSSLTAIKKVYNMYGIGAIDSNANNAGAIRAYEEGWDTPKKAIEGGAKWVGQQYIHNSYNQNTLYKMRWNPRMSEGYAWKQYATDIGWARKQISRIKEVYTYIDQPNYHYDIAKYK